MVSSVLTLMRNVQGSTMACPWSYMYRWCIYSVTIYNGLCTRNMFMVLQVVTLWLYNMSYTFCVFICFKCTKIYLKNYRGKEVPVAVNQHSMQIWLRMSGLTCARLVLSLLIILISVTLSKMLLLGQWLPYIENTSWIAYISLQWQL